MRLLRAIHVKRHRTLLFLVESSGGIGNHRGRRARAVRPPLQTARGHIGADRTTYGTIRTSPKTFLMHHIQQITKAAVFYDAKAILKAVDFRNVIATLAGRPLPRSIAHIPRSIAHLLPRMLIRTLMARWAGRVPRPIPALPPHAHSEHSAPLKRVGDIKPRPVVKFIFSFNLVF